MELKDWCWGHLKPLHYGVISADPGWKFKTYSDAGLGKAPKYTTMETRYIKKLPIMDLARPDAICAMWVTDPFLDQGLEVLDAWGFTFKTILFYWVKTYDLFGTQSARLDLIQAALDTESYDALVDAMCPIIQSHWTRANPEICLLGTHGAPLRLSGGIRKTIFAPQREHSRKPDEALERLEQLCAGPYVELNSRTNRPGWDAWGDQTGFFDEEEIGK